MHYFFQVQTEDQYVFIHEALLEAVMAGTTEIPCRNLHQYIQSLMQTEPGENITSMELEFKKLSNLATTEPQRYIRTTSVQTIFCNFQLIFEICNSMKYPN